jgi:hypothetical protein
MSEPTPPPHDQTEPATGPVMTPPTYREPPPVPSQPVYVERRDSSRLNKAAAWVGIVAGSLFIVVVIFGAGFLTGKAVSNGHRGDYDRGHEMMMRPGTAMFPTGPPGGTQRGPTFSGPFGPGQIIEIPRPPGGAPTAPDTPAPSRP